MCATLLATVGEQFRHLWIRQQAIARIGNVPYYAPGVEDIDWWRRSFGFDLFSPVRLIDVRSDQAIAVLLTHRDEFAELEQLDFFGGVTDAGLERIAELNSFSKLRYACFYDTDGITEAGMKRVGDWINLRSLFFNSCDGITDDCLAHLGKLPNLESLSLFDEWQKKKGERGKMPISDAGLAYLGRLQRLKHLDFHYLPITDAGLPHLTTLSGLETLSICSAKITPQGFEDLCRALPDCRIRLDDHLCPSPVQIRQISIWELSPQERRVATICQADRIAAIIKCLDEYGAGNWGVKASSPPRLRLDFEGRNRCLCQIRLGDGSLELWVGRWNCRLLSQPEVQRLLNLLGVDPVSDRKAEITEKSR